MKKCAVCGSSDIHSGARDVPYTYKGVSALLQGVEGEHCLSCNEIVMTTEQADAFLAKINTLEAAIDNGTFTSAETMAPTNEPAFIAAVRSKLRLSQREAGEMFGGGVNAFNRYESGKAKAPRATVKLLRVLNMHPELLEIVRPD